RRVHHHAGAEVDAHVVQVAVEEDQVAGAQLLPGDVPAGGPLVAGVVRQRDADAPVGGHDEPGAVVAAGAGRAPDVRLELLGESPAGGLRRLAPARDGEVHPDGPGAGAAGLAECALEQPALDLGDELGDAVALAAEVLDDLVDLVDAGLGSLPGPL